MIVSKTFSEFGPTAVKGILGNWQVCLAEWVSPPSKAKDVTGGKYFGMLLPISSFVAIGFEHSVADMFWLSAGVPSQAGVDIKTTLLKNVLPCTLENIIPGALLIGGGFSWQLIWKARGGTAGTQFLFSSPWGSMARTATCH